MKWRVEFFFIEGSPLTVEITGRKELSQVMKLLRGFRVRDNPKLLSISPDSIEKVEIKVIREAFKSGNGENLLMLDSLRHYYSIINADSQQRSAVELLE